jgi:hypothetical protein
VEFAKEHRPEFALILREMAQGQNLSEGADFSIAEFPLRRSLNFFKDRLASPLARSRPAGVTAGTVAASPTPLPRGK